MTAERPVEWRRRRRRWRRRRGQHRRWQQPEAKVMSSRWLLLLLLLLLMAMWLTCKRSLNFHRLASQSKRWLVQRPLGWHGRIDKNKQEPGGRGRWQVESLLSSLHAAEQRAGRQASWSPAALAGVGSRRKCMPSRTARDLVGCRLNASC